MIQGVSRLWLDVRATSAWRLEAGRASTSRELVFAGFLQWTRCFQAQGVDSSALKGCYGLSWLYGLAPLDY